MSSTRRSAIDTENALPEKPQLQYRNRNRKSGTKDDGERRWEENYIVVVHVLAGTELHFVMIGEQRSLNTFRSEGTIPLHLLESRCCCRGPGRIARPSLPRWRCPRRPRGRSRLSARSPRHITGRNICRCGRLSRGPRLLSRCFARSRWRQRRRWRQVLWRVHDQRIPQQSPPDDDRKAAAPCSKSLQHRRLQLQFSTQPDSNSLLQVPDNNNAAEAAEL